MTQTPQLRCPRCASVAMVLTDMIETDEVFDGPDVPFPIPIIEIVLMAHCAADCGEPSLRLPHDVRRTGWLPPAAFDEASKRWYVEQETAT